MSIKISFIKLAALLSLFFIFLTITGYVFFDIAGDINNKYTNVGNIALTVTNYGTLGKGFCGTQPSCMYPINSGIENLYLGGIWVGGVKNGNVLVSTGAIDVSTAGRNEGFEFSSPPGGNILERSSLQTSPNYRPEAISHQDFVTEFIDTNVVINGTLVQNHTPLGLKVMLQTYCYNLNFANNWVIFNYKIVNIGYRGDNGPIDSLYLGVWSDFVVRNTNVTPGCGAGTSFFNKGANGFIDSLSMEYAYDYSGDPGFTDNYAALKILGANPRPSGEKVKSRAHYTIWQFKNSNDPVYFWPTQDNDPIVKGGRFQKMEGYASINPVTFIDSNRINQLRQSPGNRTTLLSYGPFRNTDNSKFSLRYNQDTLNIVYAVICAKKNGTDPATMDTEFQKLNLYTSAGWAQRAYDNGYKLPAPPDNPITHYVVEDKKVTLYWAANAERSVDPISNLRDFEGYRIYRTNPGFDLNLSSDLTQDLKLIAEFDSAHNAYSNNTGFGFIKLATPIMFEGDTNQYWYKFEFPNQLNGFQYIYSVTSFDKGDPSQQLGSLESAVLSNSRRIFVGSPANNNPDAEVGVYPNPYYGSAIWDGTGAKKETLRKLYFFNLPSKCEISIWTIAGDLVDKISHDAATYNGSDISWFRTYTDGNQKLSGGEHAWDMISRNDQAIATGLYIFTVNDLSTGKIKKGKFLIVK